AKTTKGKNGVSPKATALKQAVPQLTVFLVNGMAFGSETWYAATAGGVLVSKDHGATWKPASKDPLTRQPAQSVEVAADGNQVWAIVERNLLYTSDKGETWDAKELAFAAAGNLRLQRADDNTLFITSNMACMARAMPGAPGTARMSANYPSSRWRGQRKRWWCRCRSRACWPHSTAENPGSTWTIRSHRDSSQWFVRGGMVRSWRFRPPRAC